MPEVRSMIVEAVVFRMAAGGPEYLLLRRGANETIYPGMWQIITGTLEQGETALAGAGREIMEETGIRPVRFWVVPHISSFYDHRHDRISLIPFFAAEVAAEADPALSDEHDAWIWLSFPAARDRRRGFPRNTRSTSRGSRPDADSPAAAIAPLTAADRARSPPAAPGRRAIPRGLLRG